MTQPSTGTTWAAAGLGDINPEAFERGPNLGALVRDARGAATDISPHNADGSLRYSPFAADNTWRDDLLARKRSGQYVVTVTTANQGFLNTGAFEDGKGPQSKPGVKSDKARIEQNNWPYHTLMTEESETFSLTLSDTGLPWNQHLRKNLRLCNDAGDIIVPDAGAVNEGYSRIAAANNPGRQFLLVRELYPPSGLPIYKVDGYSLCRLDDMGNSKKAKKDSEAVELTCEPELDNIMMGFAPNAQGVFEYQPILMHTWYGGAGRTALGGIPVITGSTTATPTGSGGGATVAIAVPTGPADPWTYAVQASSDSGVTWGSAITPSGVAVSSGTVTLTVAGIAAGSKKLRVQVTGTNGVKAYSPASSAITIV